MYRPAIMGLLFCSAILLGSVFCLYLNNTSRAEPEHNPLLDLKIEPMTEEEISDLKAALDEWDCELLREVHGRGNSDQTY